MTEHPRDDLAAYALGALDPEEVRIVRMHLLGCADCRRELSGYEDTLWQVAETGPLIEPPADLRQRLVARHRRAAPLRFLLEWLRRPVPLVAPAALTLALVLALAGLAGARQDASAYERALRDVAGGEVTPLTSTQAALRGVIVVPAAGDPYLLLSLPAAPPGEVWEAWVLRGQRAIPAGVSDRSGVFTIRLSEPLGPGDKVAVTSEPRPGSDRPTRTPVLVGGG